MKAPKWLEFLLDKRLLLRQSFFIVKKLTQKEFLERAFIVHKGRYDYSEAIYTDAKTAVKIICPAHGVFSQKAYKHLAGQGCSACARNQPLTKEERVKNARKIHGDKFDYSQCEYSGNHIKTKIICRDCGNILYQSPHNHLARGCSVCSRKHKYSTKEWVALARKTHGDAYDYSEAEYKGANEKILIICPVHGRFWQTPREHVAGNGCPVCGKNKGESRIAAFLETKNYKLNETYFTEQTFDGCEDKAPLRFDFYIPSKNLLVEYNGIQHYKSRELFGGEKQLHIQRHHDWLKRKYARDHGVKLLTIPYTRCNDIPALLDSFL